MSPDAAWALICLYLLMIVHVVWYFSCSPWKPDNSCSFLGGRRRHIFCRTVYPPALWSSCLEGMWWYTLHTCTACYNWPHRGQSDRHHKLSGRSSSYRITCRPIGFYVSCSHVRALRMTWLTVTLTNSLDSTLVQTNPISILRQCLSVCGWTLRCWYP